MALNYYIDPFPERHTGTVRVVRDKLVRWRAQAEGRMVAWAARQLEADAHFFRAKTTRTRDRWAAELDHIGRWARKAEADRDAFQAALEEGDGRRPYRYRWSVSYQGGADAKGRVQVDILLHKVDHERASEDEVKRTVGDLMRDLRLDPVTGVPAPGWTPPEGWTVEYVTWYHGEQKTPVVNKRADPAQDAKQQRAVGDMIPTVGLAAFRTVIQEQRPYAVVGEEELDRNALASVAHRTVTKAKARGRPTRKGRHR